MYIVSNRNIIVSIFVLVILLLSGSDSVRRPATRGEKVYRLKVLLVKLVVNKIINRITLLSYLI